VKEREGALEHQEEKSRPRIPAITGRCRGGGRRKTKEEGKSPSVPRGEKRPKVAERGGGVLYGEKGEEQRLGASLIRLSWL